MEANMAPLLIYLFGIFFLPWACFCRAWDVSVETLLFLWLLWCDVNAIVAFIDIVSFPPKRPTFSALLFRPFPSSICLFMSLAARVMAASRFVSDSFDILPPFPSPSAQFSRHKCLLHALGMLWGCSGDALGMLWGCSGDAWEPLKMLKFSKDALKFCGILWDSWGCFGDALGMLWGCLRTFKDA